MNQRKTRFWIIVYALTMVSVLICLFCYLLSVLNKISTLPPTKETEYVYISDDSEQIPTEEPKPITESGWIVKEHMGKIGIFQKDGTLLQVLDTYVKTLPEADQTLLGEGFEILTQSELNAIIEDYSD